MNIDKNLIRHWAMLFESEDVRKNGEESFLDGERTLGEDVGSPSGDFEIQDGVLLKYWGESGDVVIPDGATSIGDCAFWNDD